MPCFMIRLLLLPLLFLAAWFSSSLCSFEAWLQVLEITEGEASWL